MKNIFKSKKAIAPLFIILFVILALIIIYVLLYLPIPAFTKVRMIINYFLIIILWLVIQVGLVYGYYRLGTFAVRGLTIIKTKLVDWSLRIRYYIIAHT